MSKESDGLLVNKAKDNEETGPLVEIEKNQKFDFKFISSTCNTKMLIEALDKSFFSVVNFVDCSTGRNILNFAACYTGNIEVAIKFIKQSIERIEDKFLTPLLLASDKNGETPLYLAAKWNNAEICKLLIAQASDLDTKNIRGKTPILKIFKKMPKVIATLILNDDFGFYEDEYLTRVKLHMNNLVSAPTAEEILKNPLTQYCELDLLSNLSYTKPKFRGPILENVLVKIFVWLKWQRCKWIFYTARLIQVLWFLVYSYFLVTVFRINCPFHSGKNFEFSWFKITPSSQSQTNSSTNGKNLSEHSNNCADKSSFAMAVILAIGAILQIAVFMIYPTVVRFRRRWFPMKTKTVWKYTKKLYLFVEMLHILDWIFVILIFLNTLPVLTNYDLYEIEFRYIFASVGIFLTWFQIFLQLGKIPHFKGYTKVFRNIMTTLTLVTLLYSSLIIAFALVFTILFPGVASFATPFEAILRVLTFAVGELEFASNFYGDDFAPPASFITAGVFYGAAVLILHIALLNFLITLTINNVQKISKESEDWRMYTYIWQIFLMESWMANFPCQLGKGYLKWARILDEDFCISLKVTHLPKFLRKEIRKLNFPLEKHFTFSAIPDLHRDTAV